ncbi:hypothetical protein NDU88_013021 [Pleurodeles waltl]|uniref:MHC class I-like antigen recognition-like domain-containing protein n=1 Tax=Pleurodeles waltl TaxID=8319 RepID=A0AAV7R2G7_PLEWA|nr:hypothetical protein NDU88_013021 [Pleurodeles waltl]
MVGYTSESRRMEPRAPWMEGITAEDPQYWERNTESHRGNEQVLKDSVRNVMERVNQTRGLHSVQWMIGCELRDDGSMGGVYQFAFDGHGFISFDKDRLTYTAATDAARITQERWNSDRSIAQGDKDYLEGTCIEYLKKYLKLGEERLRTAWDVQQRQARAGKPEQEVFPKKTSIEENAARSDGAEELERAPSEEAASTVNNGRIQEGRAKKWKKMKKMEWEWNEETGSRSGAARRHLSSKGRSDEGDKEVYCTTPKKHPLPDQQEPNCRTESGTLRDTTYHDNARNATNTRRQVRVHDMTLPLHDDIRWVSRSSVTHGEGGHCCVWG